ncbi:hypothetical protein BX600DRAFT_252908 [Xylariales sp. PMI_506]|nr:hypothetical protein BX600DRAFT_252908 [Xylariales sp. PMI_506]
MSSVSYIIRGSNGLDQLNIQGEETPMCKDSRDGPDTSEDLYPSVKSQSTRASLARRHLGLCYSNPEVHSHGGLPLEAVAMMEYLQRPLSTIAKTRLLRKVTLYHISARRRELWPRRDSTPLTIHFSKAIASHQLPSCETRQKPTSSQIGAGDSNATPHKASLVRWFWRGRGQ